MFTNQAQSVIEALNLLREALPYIESQNGAEHMLDGFRGRKPAPSDDLLSRVKALLDADTNVTAASFIGEIVGGAVIAGGYSIDVQVMGDIPQSLRTIGSRAQIAAVPASSALIN